MLDKGYDPKPIEDKWYREWMEHEHFHAKAEGCGDPYCIVIPPPNVTGSLHMGHALNSTLQDILIRYKRMDGFNALWLPGTDHAGIATQNVVEKVLAAEGLTRQQVGRERFLERVWKWKEQYGGIIVEQLKRLGASCDWWRLRFTMDQGLSSAVREVFVRLYEDGLIYRGSYIINWCPRCQTALADLEVEHTESEGQLWHLRYPLAGRPGSISVATTRPETMLGDTAVAVHPEDGRYRELVGSRVVLPLVNREIPIIADPSVDPEFGSGAVKITPAHDFNDFEMARRHGLAQVQVMDEEGRMNAEAGAYRGLTREACREKVVADLDRQGLLVKTEPYKTLIGHCYRCRTVVEPYLSLQWFVSTKPLAEPAMAAVRSGRIRIIPANWADTYFEWMENIRDWCISRQIWWGHRIPAWYCGECGKVTVSRTDPDRCRHCGSGRLEQESDVLDTWFSSALWPFSTLGWPEKTRDLEVYYPTSAMVTGFDILFFWVARMIMMGLYCMGEVPFRDVYIHALVRDAEGQKMSKSRGNVIDPLLVIEEHGADSFRYTLAALAAQGRDIRLSEERIRGYRHFMNKIWNATRFVLMNLQGWTPPAEPPAPSRLDRWLISRLEDTVEKVRAALDAYRFNEAAHLLYQFIWHEFCDWYLEFTKVELSLESAEDRAAGVRRAEAERVRYYLHRSLGVLLRLLHPLAPFISEELWAALPGAEGSLVHASFPRPGELVRDPAAEAEVEAILRVITSIRNVRGELNVPPAEKLSARVVCRSAARRVSLEGHAEYVRSLARLSQLEVLAEGERPAQSAVTVLEDLEIYLRLGGILNFQEEIARLEKGGKKVAAEVERLEKKLANPQFVDRAPREIVDKERARLEELRVEKGKIDVHQAQLLEIARG
jgi:valyl-tRNA synthetase